MFKTIWQDPLYASTPKKSERYKDSAASQKERKKGGGAAKAAKLKTRPDEDEDGEDEDKSVVLHPMAQPPGPDRALRRSVRKKVD